MGSYYIPRDLGGESRILIIFSVKSLITTAIGAGVGLIFYFIFSALGLGMAGVITMAIFAFIGYAVGALKIPTIAGLQSIAPTIWHPVS